MKGRITVEHSVDSSGDYHGINVTVINPDTTGKADTLFQASTDTMGYFRGKAFFKYPGRYIMIIGRNNNALGHMPVLLGVGDTVTVTAVLPDLDKTLKISSREHTAYQAYQRVAAGYQRILNFVNVGAVPQDTIPSLVKTWSKLFWSIRKDYPGTIAAKQSEGESIRILSGVDDNLLMQRFNKLKDEDIKSNLARTAANAVARQKNLNAAVLFLDSLENKARETDAKMNYASTAIQMLYDSSRIGQAKKALADFEQNFSKENKNAGSWASHFQYDLDSLTNGQPMPPFKVITLKGDTVSNATLHGHPYILEITAVANSDYQQEYSQIQVVYEIYKRTGLKMLTVPIDSSNVIIRGFLEGRAQDWPFGRAKAYKISHMIKTLNIQNVPTRFLVDSRGDIIRKYGPDDTNRMLKDLTALMAKKNKKGH